MSDPTLTCYADDGTDWVIAHSPEDASAIWEEHVGEPHSDEEHGPWRPCDPDKSLTVDLDDGRGGRTQTFREWIAECGRGFFCSENY
jgi:hypothetical protein